MISSYKESKKFHEVHILYTKEEHETFALELWGFYFLALENRWAFFTYTEHWPSSYPILKKDNNEDNHNPNLPSHSK